MSAATADTDIPVSPSRNRSTAKVRRLVLMLIVPLALVLAGGYFWVTGGRYVSTDNAYLQQDKAMLAPDVAGRIVEVAVRENDTVHRGDLLFRIDPEPSRLALQQAEAAIASARLNIEQMRAAYLDAMAEQRASEENLDFQRRELDRQKTLLSGGYAAQSKFDQVRHDFQAAEQRLAQARQGVESAKAALGGNPDILTDSHPQVMEAIAKRDQARRDLEHTDVRAPADGIISQTDRLMVGQYMPVGTPALALVETGRTWIEANFKETDLTHMTVGQTATFELDTYPGRELHATVASIGAGTGSEFSLLPAQNATGNWVKVVQRVPVRLAIEKAPSDVPLRTGLSANVEVDTGHARGLPSPIRSALAWTGIGSAAASDIQDK
jgi:membrane fusion protein (multidrug efflux system)